MGLLLVRCERVENAIRLLRSDVDSRLRRTNEQLKKHDRGEIKLPRAAMLELQGYASGCASIIDLIDTMMRENGIPKVS